MAWKYRAGAAVILGIASILGPNSALAEPPVVYPGHSAIWFDPSRSGEGYVLEIISESAATLTWFTYDDQGRQRWLFGVGQVARAESGGAFLLFNELYDTRGGVFGHSFDPALVELNLVGSAEMEFSDCGNGVFSYDVYSVADSVAIQRIATTMGVDCAPAHGAPDAKLAAYAGESGSWFDPAHTGEGFQLQWTSANQALLTWYSYDAEGRQYWMTGVGTREGSKVSFPSLVATRGARFGAEFDAGDVERFHWGSLTLELGLDCGGGRATYSSDIPGFAPGEQALSKLTGLLGVPCPWEAPKLADLYDIELTQIPTVLPSEGLPVSVQVFSMADNGTLIGATARDGMFQVHRLSPGASTWEAISERNLSSIPFQISADATRILVNEDNERLTDFSPLIMESGGEWRPLNGLIFDESSALAGSRQLKHVIGIGRPHEDHTTYPWIWSEEDGQVELPRTESIRLAYPLALSEQGDIVVGFSYEPNSSGQPTAAGIRWNGPVEPEYLRDSIGAKLGSAAACSANCRIIFGNGHAEGDAAHPFTDQSWVVLESGDVDYFGHIGNAITGAGSPYKIRQTTADGSMAVGDYFVFRNDGMIRTDPLFWTRFTGLASLRELAGDLDLTTLQWKDIFAMDVSSDGSLVLLLGWDDSDGSDSPTIFRAAVLLLQPLRLGQIVPPLSEGNHE